MHLIAWAGQFGSACFRSNIPSDLRNKTGLPSGREPQFPANGHRAGMSGRCRRGGFPHASRLFSNTRLSFSPKSASAAEGRAAGLDPTCRHAAGLAVTTPAQDEGAKERGMPSPRVSFRFCDSSARQPFRTRSQLGRLMCGTLKANGTVSKTSALTMRYEGASITSACYLCNTLRETRVIGPFRSVLLLCVQGRSVIVTERRRGASRGRPVLGGSLKSLAFSGCVRRREAAKR